MCGASDAEQGFGYVHSYDIESTARQELGDSSWSATNISNQLDVLSPDQFYERLKQRAVDRALGGRTQLGAHEVDVPLGEKVEFVSRSRYVVRA
jgi:hypothetical protein